MYTFFRLLSVIVNLAIAVAALVAIPMVVVDRGPTWEAWFLAAIAVLNTVALNLVVTATIERKEKEEG